MRFHPPNKVFVEAEVANTQIVQNLRMTLPDGEFCVVDNFPEAVHFDPQMLEVVSFKGRFLKSCPGTNHYCCCGYQILHFGSQCSLGCTYCILQAYLNQPNMRLFANTDRLFEELAGELQAHPHHLYRIGTGEFTDSLLLDPWLQFSRRLVPFFADQPNAILELKTKTNFVENLADLDHGGHTIVAWSLNSETIRRREESRTATIQERLDAAWRCAQWGYSLAFHFDPLIEHPHWRNGYGEILDRLFDTVDSARIVWISLGAFRFMPDLKAIIRAKHPQSRILYGEFIRGLDNKMRYFRDIRIELYAFMLERIRKIDSDLCVYLCMEGKDIWRETFGFSPDELGGLPAMLDQAVKEKMGIGLHCPLSAKDTREEKTE